MSGLGARSSSASGRESRSPASGRPAAALEHPDLAFQEQVEELAVAELGCLGALDQLVGVLGDRVQAQLCGVALDALGDQLSHR